MLNLAQFGGYTDGVTDAFARLQAAFDNLTDNDEIYVPPKAVFLISDTLTITALERFRVFGPGTFKPSNAVVNKPVLQLTDNRDSALEGFSILGNPGNAPSAGVRFHQTDTVASGGYAQTHMKLKDIRIGSPSADSLVDGIDYTASSDQNNAESEHYGVKVQNISGVAVNVKHTNSLVHRIYGGVYEGATGAFRLAVGNLSAFGAAIAGTWLVDVADAGNQEHSIELIGCHSEGPYKVLRIDGDNRIFHALGCHFKGGVNSTDNIEILGNHCRVFFTNSHVHVGGSGIVADLGAGTSNRATFEGCSLGFEAYQWGGHLSLLGNYHEPGGVTYTPGASATLNELGNRGAEGSGDAKQGVRLALGGVLSGGFRTTYSGSRLGVLASDYSANPIPANSTATFTIPVTGISGGSFRGCFASPNDTLGAGLSWSAYPSGTDTVTVVVANCTTGSVTPNARDWVVFGLQI